MWGIALQSGLSTVVLDFTNELSPLLLGLVGLLWFSASAIVWMTIRHYRAQKTMPVGMLESTSDHQEAA